ncbi:MAG TPA: hypothetical protein ENK09_10885 [Nitrospirae bacterium]|nr:hypothetical protein [Nitrospirota bacterium]
MKDWLIIWYGATSFLMGLLLYFPMRKLILAMSANRAHRRLKRDLTDEEMKNLRKKSMYLSIIISMTFSFLYNRVMMFKFFGGLGQ